MSDLQPLEILLTAAQIRARVAEMAQEIRQDYPDDLHIIAVLKGAFIFLSDLARHIPGHVSLDFMALSSYAKGTTSSGEVRLQKDLDYALDGRNVIIVEDIVDTGLTLNYLQEILRSRGPKSLRTACLLSKPSRRKVDVKVEYTGFTIEDRFVVGPCSASSPDGVTNLDGEPLRVGNDGVAIQRPHLAILHHHLAVDDRRPHIVAAGDVDEV
jgi:hypoxanthine phosphoribosyltransferase